MDILNSVIRCVLVSVYWCCYCMKKKEKQWGENRSLYTFFYQEIEGDRRQFCFA